MDPPQQQKKRMQQLCQYLPLYKNQLLQQVIPFWQNNSLDKENGGYFTCLNEKGQIYDTDKFMWLQGRQVWTFSMLYNKIEKKKQWLDIAVLGAKFIIDKGMDQDGNCYFSLDKQGKPLVQPYNIFSDCFVAMAFAQLFRATGQQCYKQLSYKLYTNITKKQSNPKGIYNKLVPNSRNLRNFALPMILCNLSLILQDIIGKQQVDKMVKPLIEDIMNNFVCKDKGIILENINGEDNTFSDCYEGRVINPGHGCQAMWFLMDLAVRYNDMELVKKCQKILLNIIKFGWDSQYSGLFYFLDIKGHPVQQLEWDQKLWWVHIQTMISLLKAYKLTGNLQCKEWFIKIHQYTWKNFRDSENGGQWYGYLNRRGQVSLKLKGGKWKGCFHVPRGLYQIWKTLQQ